MNTKHIVHIISGDSDQHKFGMRYSDRFMGFLEQFLIKFEIPQWRFDLVHWIDCAGWAVDLCDEGAPIYYQDSAILAQAVTEYRRVQKGRSYNPDYDGYDPILEGDMVVTVIPAQATDYSIRVYADGTSDVLYVLGGKICGTYSETSLVKE